MFLTFGSQHARQSPQLLFCFGAGQFAALVTTVDVFGQAPAGAWSIIGIENLTTKFFGALPTCFPVTIGGYPRPGTLKQNLSSL